MAWRPRLVLSQNESLLSYVLSHTGMKSEGNKKRKTLALNKFFHTVKLKTSDINVWIKKSFSDFFQSQVI